MSWVTRHPKTILILALVLLVTFLILRYAQAFLQLRSFLLGLSIGLFFGVLPYVWYRWLRSKKKE